MATSAEMELASPPGDDRAVYHAGDGYDDDDGEDYSQQGGAGVDLESTRHEVLEMNSYAMHLCQEKAFTEAMDCLETALLRVQALADHIVAGDEPSRRLLDQLKATTLNNLGVVGCHRGDYDQSLEHLEAARNLESRAGIQSPSTALNLCAVYNAIGDSERASAHAQEAIALLNADDQGMTEETKSLWGAAWHNLGIAELNKLDKTTSHTKNADVLYTFRNAMAATKDLLGPQHPMTIAVHDTYRRIRSKLKEEGAFRERQPVITLPRIRNGKTAPRPPSPEHPTRHALMGTSNNHGNGKYTAPPPVSRFVGIDAYKKPEPPRTPRGGASTGRSKYVGGDLFHPTAAMKAARRQYCSQHPLLPPKPGTARGNTRGGNGLPAIADRAPATASRSAPQHVAPPPQQQQPQRQAQAPAYGAPAGSRQPPKRRLSELLLGDMWVEVQVPRHSSPNANSGGGGGNNGVGGSSGAQHMSPVRPGYGEALYVIDPADAAMEPIAEPGSHAELDHVPEHHRQAYATAGADLPDDNIDAVYNHHAAAPAPLGAEEAAVAPANAGDSAHPVEEQGSIDGVERRSTSAGEFADALGSQLSQYPGLQTLVESRA